MEGKLDMNSWNIYNYHTTLLQRLETASSMPQAEQGEGKGVGARVTALLCVSQLLLLFRSTCVYRAYVQTIKYSLAVALVRTVSLYACMLHTCTSMRTGMRTDKQLLTEAGEPAYRPAYEHSINYTRGL